MNDFSTVKLNYLSGAAKILMKGLCAKTANKMKRTVISTLIWLAIFLRRWAKESTEVENCWENYLVVLLPVFHSSALHTHKNSHHIRDKKLWKKSSKIYSGAKFSGGNKYQQERLNEEKQWGKNI